jgi:hypothetical protein
MYRDALEAWISDETKDPGSNWDEAIAPVDVVSLDDLPCTESRRYLLVDGWHRIAALEQIGQIEVRARICVGDRAHALEIASQANAAHGLQMSTADKRRAVRMHLTTGLPSAQDPDRAIARRLGVSHTLVGEIRRELAEAQRQTARDLADRDDLADDAAPHQTLLDDLPEPPAALTSQTDRCRWRVLSLLAAQAAAAEAVPPEADAFLHVDRIEELVGMRGLKASLRAAAKLDLLIEEEYGQHSWAITLAGHNWLTDRGYGVDDAADDQAAATTEATVEQVCETLAAIIADHGPQKACDDLADKVAVTLRLTDLHMEMRQAEELVWGDAAVEWSDELDAAGIVFDAAKSTYRLAADGNVTPVKLEYAPGHGPCTDDADDDDVAPAPTQTPALRRRWLIEQCRPTVAQTKALTTRSAQLVALYLGLSDTSTDLRQPAPDSDRHQVDDAFRAAAKETLDDTITNAHSAWEEAKLCDLLATIAAEISIDWPALELAADLHFGEVP